MIVLFLHIYWSVCALFCDFHRYRRYHIRDQRESTRLRQANTNTLNHDSYQKNNVTSYLRIMNTPLVSSNSSYHYYVSFICYDNKHMPSYDSTDSCLNFRGNMIPLIGVMV
jgi:hypothetical protein